MENQEPQEINLNQIKSEFKNGEKIFKEHLTFLCKAFQQKCNQLEKENWDDVIVKQIYKEPPDFGLFYFLSEALEQVERCIDQKPCREYSIVKTKLQEAMFWIKEV